MKSLKKEMLQHERIWGNMKFDWDSWGDVASVYEESALSQNASRG